MQRYSTFTLKLMSTDYSLIFIIRAACDLYNVCTVVTTSHGITSLALVVIPKLGSYTMAGQLYYESVQGVSHGIIYML